MKLNEKNDQGTRVGNKNFCYDVTSLVTGDRDERMALRHQRNKKNVPKVQQVSYFNRDGKLKAMARGISEGI